VTAENTDQRRKILFIPAWYPTPENPIAAKFVRDHARAAAIYDDVAVLHVLPGRPRRGRAFSWHEETDEGIPTIRVRVPDIRGVSYPLGVVAAYERLNRRGYRPHVIHAHIFNAGLPAALISKLHHVPLVTTEHWTGFLMKRLSRSAQVRAKIAFTSSRYVCPVSSPLREAIASYGIRARFKIVPNTIDTELFRPKVEAPAGDVKHLICVAILDQERKGIDYLLEAVSLLNAGRDDFHLHVVGEGPRRAAYEELSGTLGIRDRVTFHGRVDAERLIQLLHQSCLFVLPSLFENFSVATAEALATGTPVLVTRCGGPEDFVTPEVGMTVPAGDAEALAGGIGAMLDDGDRYDHEALAAYARERFSLEAVGRLLHEVYCESLSEN
jgi:glycosyltransferase involved in cell wall biosynthesis